MDYTIDSETVVNEERSSIAYEEEGGIVPECEQLAHDRLLQLLISSEHHFVHAF